MSLYEFMWENITGWWLTYPSEKYEFVSWDDEIFNIWKVIKIMFQTNNQVRMILGYAQKKDPGLGAILVHG